MAIPKTPFFSLGSKGTVADTLTSQKRGRQTLVRAKPVPTDPRSDPQIWHRHIYLVGCQLWNGLSNAQKQTYRTAGARYHRPGLAQFLYGTLPLLHQLSAYWPLDILLPSTTQDYSGNHNHFTITGASPTDGVFNKALYFDGINDFIRTPASPPLNFSTHFTIALWTKDYWSFVKSLDTDRTWSVWRHPATDEIRIYLSLADPTLWDCFLWSSIAITDSLWHFIVITFRSGELHIYIDGILRDGTLTGTIPPAIRTNTQPVELGRMHPDTPNYRQGYVDEPMLLLPYLTQADVTLLFNRQEAS